MAGPEAYSSGIRPDWCPGCGDFSVLAAIRQALAELEIDPDSLLVVSGIGCSSNLPGYLNSYGIHSLHGRGLAVAGGAWFANHEMPVIACGGDGDGYGIGLGHFLHAARRNVNITYIVMNNGVYGLTTGQVSPTSPRGLKTKTTPDGNIERPVNPVSLGLIAGATYVARGASSDTKHLAGLIAGGIRHHGFAHIDVLSPCVTFNHSQTYEWLRKVCYRLEDDGHDPSSQDRAFERALEWGDRVPLGLFFRTERPCFADEDAVLKSGTLASRPLELTKEQKDTLLERLR